MREYSKVSPAFWTKGSGKALRGDRNAQLVALYLVTCPSANMIGLYYLPMALIAHETGLELADCRKALQRVSAAGFASYDEVSELVWVPNGAAYQTGEQLSGTDKRKVGVLRELYAFRNHPFSLLFFAKYAAPYGLVRPPWLPETLTQTPEINSSPSDASSSSSSSSRKRERDLDQEDPDQVVVSGPAQFTLVSEPSSPPAASKHRIPIGDVRVVFEHWARNRKRLHTRGPEPKLDDARADVIRERLRDGFDVETLKLAVEGIWRSAWHRGQNDRGTEYTEIRHAIGDAAKVEKFAELAQRARDLAKPKSPESTASQPDAPAPAPSEPSVAREA